MTLVITFLSSKALDVHEKTRIAEYYKEIYANVKVFSFDYKNRKYHEYDIDLIDIQFDKANLHKELDEVIFQTVSICKELKIDVDVIIANDDTETEVLEYEKDKDNVSSFGLFITKRVIPDVKFKSIADDYYIFQNLSYTSFGVFN